MAMITMAAMAADALGSLLAEDFRRFFGSTHGDLAERLNGIARVALECLGKSDALYHNVEHTLLVTQVGRERRGRPSKAPRTLMFPLNRGRGAELIA
jgi:hypothetical protein